MDADTPLGEGALLGAILVRTAGLSLETLQVALDQQKSSGDQLGAILRDMKAISGGRYDLTLQITTCSTSVFRMASTTVG